MLRGGAARRESGIRRIVAGLLGFLSISLLALAVGREARAAEERAQLAFVLLPEARLPKAEAVVGAFAKYASKDARLEAVPADPDAKPGSKQGRAPAQGPTADPDKILEFDLKPHGHVLVGLIPMAVPNREADEAARFSVSALGTGWEPPPHVAHLIVTLRGLPGGPPIEALDAFTSVLAAVADASGATAIYWGEAHATHQAAFLLQVAALKERAPRLMLWSGLSLARESDGRISLLSLGMSQLDLPDLLMVAPGADGAGAIATFYDLLDYVAERGRPLPEGDTVGRTSEERRPVSYVPSPIDPTRQVWRVEFE